MILFAYCESLICLRGKSFHWPLGYLPTWVPIQSAFTDYAAASLWLAVAATVPLIYYVSIVSFVFVTVILKLWIATGCLDSHYTLSFIK